MSSSSIPSDSIILAPAEDRESKTPEMSFEDLYRVVVAMSTSLEQVTLQNNKLVQLNGELIKKVECLELSVKELKENCASKKTFAQVVTAGLKSSAAQVSFIKSAEIANDNEKRNAAVILDKIELPENVSCDGQLGQALLKACEVQDGSVTVFRLQKKSRPAVAQLQLQKKGRCQEDDVKVQQNKVRGSRLLVCSYPSRPVEATARKATCGMEGGCYEEQQSRRVSLHCEKPGMCEGAIQRGRSPSRLGNSRNAHIKHPVSTLKVGYANCCSVVIRFPF
uniref:Uncharacterized protein n=1 Tax=Caenorhabditis japonica TaxID=281687 RepID=A0A8R1EEY9_CAEJA